MSYVVRDVVSAADAAAVSSPETKGRRNKLEEEEGGDPASSEFVSGVSLLSDDTDLRDDLVTEALAEFRAEFTNGGNVYRCEVCPVHCYFNSQLAFWKHFTEEHVEDKSRRKTAAAEYRAAHPDYRIDTAPKAQCKACWAWLRRDWARWSRHLEKEHGGIELEEYFVRYEFVPVSGESEEREDATNIVSAGTPHENVIPSATASKRNHHDELPNDEFIEQDTLSVCEMEGDQTAAEMEGGVGTIVDPCSSCDEIEVGGDIEIEEHPIIPVNPDTGILTQPFLNMLKLTELKERYNRCVFECQICHMFFDSVVGIVAHLNSRHDINYADHNAKYGRARVMENVFSCELCDGRFDPDRNRFRSPNELFSDGHLIQRHLLHAHGLNLLQYDRIVRGGDLWYDTCVYRCRLCPSGETFAGSAGFDAHLAAAHAGQSKKTSMALVCKSNYECAVCQKVVAGVPGTFDRHLGEKHGLAATDYLKLWIQTLLRPSAKVTRVEVPAVEVPKEWFNGCLFACAICKEHLNGSDHMERHVITLHKLPYPAYKKKHGLGRLTSPRYKCLECWNLTLHDERSLKEHFQLCHRMTLDSYTNQYAAEIVKAVTVKTIEEKVRDLAAATKKRKAAAVANALPDQQSKMPKIAEAALPECAQDQESRMARYSAVIEGVVSQHSGEQSEIKAVDTREKLRSPLAQEEPRQQPIPAQHPKCAAANVKPKRPGNAEGQGQVTPFILFSVQRRRELKENNHAQPLTQQEIMKSLGAEWKALSEADKEPYKKEAERTNLTRQPKFAAYTLWRRKMAQENPVVPARELDKMLRQQWRVLSEEEKKPFMEAAKLAMKKSSMENPAASTTAAEGGEHSHTASERPASERATVASTAASDEKPKEVWFLKPMVPRPPVLPTAAACGLTRDKAGAQKKVEKEVIKLVVRRKNSPNNSWISTVPFNTKVE